MSTDNPYTIICGNEEHEYPTYGEALADAILWARESANMYCIDFNGKPTALISAVKYGEKDAILIDDDADTLAEYYLENYLTIDEAKYIGLAMQIFEFTSGASKREIMDEMDLKGVAQIIREEVQSWRTS